MELTAGYPLSLISNGLMYHYPKFQGHTRTQVVIIGGGISGALSAYYLVMAGIDCILVDGRSIGLGSTCASTSLLQYELDTPLHELIKKTGQRAAVRAYQLCGEAIEKLNTIVDETGYSDHASNQSLFFTTRASEKSFLKKEYAARKEAGFDLQWIGARDMAQLCGLQATFGLLSQTGASINAYTFTHHLLQYCIKKGLNVYDRTKVKTIVHHKNHIELVTEEDAHIKAAYAVNASGYEIVNFIGKKIVDFDCTYALASEHNAGAQSPWDGRFMLWNTDDPYLYMRLTEDNRIIAGGRDEPFSNKATRQLFLERKTRQLEKDVKRVMPSLNLKTEFSWSGTFGKTRDSLPYIGRYQPTPRIFYALGFGGNGITFSQVAAEMIRDELLGTPHPDAPIFAFDRT